MIWTTSSWRVDKCQMRKCWYYLAQHPAGRREVTMFQFVFLETSAFLSIVLPSFSLYSSFRFIGSLPHFRLRWVFQTGILEAQGRKRFSQSYVAISRRVRAAACPSWRKQRGMLPSSVYSLCAWSSYIGMQHSQTPRSVGSLHTSIWQLVRQRLKDLKGPFYIDTSLCYHFSASGKCGK